MTEPGIDLAPGTAPSFDPARLRDFLSATFGPAPMRLAATSGGQSNPTYFLDFGANRWVLRKQPEGDLLPKAHAIDREYRVLEALHPTDVPVPRPVLYHADPALLGTPFYLMEHVEGRVFDDTRLLDMPSGDRAAAYRSIAQTLAALHAVDPVAVGLEGFGPPSDFYNRQLRVWSRQWRAGAFADLPELDRTERWIIANMPADDGINTIVHGDFRVGNLVFDARHPRVIAVLDWELSTLGHPMSDLAFCCLPWVSGRDEYGGFCDVDWRALDLPEQEAFTDWYYRASDAPVRMQPFHLVFSLFRFAAIFAGIADRAARGNAVSDDAEEKGRLAVAFARRALQVIDARA